MTCAHQIHRSSGEQTPTHFWQTAQRRPPCLTSAGDLLPYPTNPHPRTNWGVDEPPPPSETIMYLQRRETIDGPYPNTGGLPHCAFFNYVFECTFVQCTYL